ncbi:MAG: DUF4258 domain-containing protein [Chloroflexi bacterium]|nr:DUF4258 domain-containing protein [Chloroflexota bacterium]
MSPKRRTYLSRHARNRMRRDGMTEVEVVAAVEHPDQVTPSGEGRMNAWKQIGESWLRVTYTVEKGTTVIVTVTPRRRGPERS